MARIIAAIVSLCFTSSILASDWNALTALDHAPRVSCLTDNWPCDDSYSGNNDYQVPTTPGN